MKKLSFSKIFTLLICCCSILAASLFLGTHIIHHSPKTILMSASWSYNYSDLEDLTQNSDLIALVSVDDSTSYITPDGIPMTNYSVLITTSIYGCSEDEVIDIVMTGGPKDGAIYEIADDPLMNMQDNFIIFARENNDGTYTILSGPQGRMSVDNGLVSSLNVSNPQVRLYNSGSNISFSSVPLDDFIAEILSYVD